MQLPEMLDQCGQRTAGSPPPGIGRPGWLRAIATGPAARQLGLLACFCAAGIAVTWPRTAYLANQLPAVDDVTSYAWDLWWTAHQITHLGNPWFTSHMAAPVGIPLAFDTTMPLLGLILAPLTLTAGPVASLALLTAVTPGLACYTMYRAARLWLRSEAGAIAAGAFFGLSTMLTFQNWYHVNISAGAVFLPLALEAAVRLQRRPGWRQGAVLGVVLGASFLVNVETAIMAALLVLLAVVPWLLRRPAAARVGYLGLGLGVAGMIASPQIIAMAYQTIADGVAGRDVHGYMVYTARLPGLFAPSPRAGSFGLPHLVATSYISRPREAIPTFGVVLSVLAVAGLAAAWRRRSAWLLAAAWLGGAWLALGPTLHIGSRNYAPLSQDWYGAHVSLLMPYTWLIRLPGLSGFREADRFVLLGLVGAAMLAGSAVDWLRFHARPLIVIVAAAGLLEAGWSGNADIGTMNAAMPVLVGPIAADHSGSIVVDVPFGLRGGLGIWGPDIAPPALVEATADGHPRAVAYVSWVPTPTIAAIKAHPFYRELRTAELGGQVRAAALAAARQDARRMGIGWVLIWSSWSWNHRAIERYLTGTGFRFDFQSDGAAVYRPVSTLP
jgi:hypothetical protein